MSNANSYYIIVLKMYGKYNEANSKRVRINSNYICTLEKNVNIYTKYTIDKLREKVSRYEIHNLSEILHVLLDAGNFLADKRD